MMEGRPIGLAKTWYDIIADLIVSAGVGLLIGTTLAQALR